MTKNLWNCSIISNQNLCGFAWNIKILFDNLLNGFKRNCWIFYFFKAFNVRLIHYANNNPIIGSFGHDISNFLERNFSIFHNKNPLGLIEFILNINIIFNVLFGVSDEFEGSFSQIIFDSSDNDQVALARPDIGIMFKEIEDAWILFPPDCCILVGFTVQLFYQLGLLISVENLVQRMGNLHVWFLWPKVVNQEQN